MIKKQLHHLAVVNAILLMRKCIGYEVQMAWLKN